MNVVDQRFQSTDEGIRASTRVFQRELIPSWSSSELTDILLSVVIPCYNEELGLIELHRRVTATCKEWGDYEIILVNDGSRDRTLGIMRQLADADPHVVVVNLSRNHGHQLALTAGLTLARGQRILILDADLQDPPELLPQMMSLMDHGVDIVYGQRRRRDGETPFKTLTAKLF